MIVQKTTWFSNNKKLLVILFIALVIRLIQVITIYSIQGDGPVYIEIAKNFYAWDFKAGLASSYPPLYPLLIAGAYSVTNDWLIAGRFVSLIFGLLTIFPVYFLTKMLFGEKIAVLSAIFFAFQPFLCRYSMMVMSEATYIFLFVCAVWLSWKAVSTQKYSLYFWTGFISGLSYLVRPEGLGVVIVTGLYVVLQDLPSLCKTFWKRMSLICILALGASVFVLPYVLHVKSETGKLQLSRKKSIIIAITGWAEDKSTIPDMTLPPEARMPAYSRINGEGYIKTFFGMIIACVKVYHPTLFLLLLFGLIRRKIVPRQKKYELFMGLFAIFYILILSLFYVSGRHLATLIPVTLFWSSIGFYELWQLISAKVSLSKSGRDSNIINKIPVVLLVCVIFSLLPFVLRPVDRDKVGRKKVGLWMKENCIKSPYIFTDSLRLAFYAEGKPVRFQNRPNINNYEDLIKFAKSPRDGATYGRKIDFIVVDKATIGWYCPNFLDSVKPSDLEVIHVQPKLSHSTYGELIVYEVKD